MSLNLECNWKALFALARMYLAATSVCHHKTTAVHCCSHALGSAAPQRLSNPPQTHEAVRAGAGGAHELSSQVRALQVLWPTVSKLVSMVAGAWPHLAMSLHRCTPPA